MNERIQAEPKRAFRLKRDARLPFLFWGGIGVFCAVILPLATGISPAVTARAPTLALELFFLCFVAICIHNLSLKVEIDANAIRVKSVFVNRNIQLRSIKAIKEESRGARLIGDNVSLRIPKVIDSFDLVLEQIREQSQGMEAEPSEAPDPE